MGCLKSIFRLIIVGLVIYAFFFFNGPQAVKEKFDKYAKEFAKMILCESSSIKPCGECKSCIEHTNNNNPDLIEIEPIQGTIKIEQIREMRGQSFRKTNNI